MPERNLSRFALGVIESPSLEDKLRPPETALEDPRTELDAPGWPARAEGLEIVAGREVRTPKLRGWPELEQRRRILHSLVNHELQAAELYAWALVQFQEAPTAFRDDLLRVLLEEQRHTLSYLQRLEHSGGGFGDYPVNGYFWRKVSLMDTPTRFVAVMSLTFENANLDHALASRTAALEAGDEVGAELFAEVHRDEIEHVRFGWRWLSRLKRSEQTMWQAYCDNLLPPLHPGRASGSVFHDEPRRRAGLDNDFIARLRGAHEQRLAEPRRPLSTLSTD